MKIKFLSFEFTRQVLRHGVVNHFLNENIKNENEIYKLDKKYGGYNTYNTYENTFRKDDISFFAIYYYNHIDIYEVKFIKNIKTFYYKTTYKNNDESTEVLKKKLKKEK